MTVFKYSGNGLSKAILQDVKGLIILDKNTAISGIKTLAGHAAYISPATTAAIHGTYIDIARGIETKTKAAEMVTSNTGFEEKTKDFAPQFVAYGLLSYADYLTWFAMDGQELDFIPVLEDGKLIAPPLNSAGVQHGFCGRLIISNKDLPKAGGAEKAKYCEFTVIFDDQKQMENQQIITPVFDRGELKSLVPVGINIEQTGAAYTTGALAIKATFRGTGLPFALFASSTEWKVVSTMLDATAVIALVSGSMGNQALTVYVTGTTPMTGSFDVQAELIQNSVVTYLSNVITIKV